MAVLVVVPVVVAVVLAVILVVVAVANVSVCRPQQQKFEAKKCNPIKVMRVRACVWVASSLVCC